MQLTSRKGRLSILQVWMQCLYVCVWHHAVTMCVCMHRWLYCSAEWHNSNHWYVLCGCLLCWKKKKKRKKTCRHYRKRCWDDVNYISLHKSAVHVWSNILVRLCKGSVGQGRRVSWYRCVWGAPWWSHGQEKAWQDGGGHGLWSAGCQRDGGGCIPPEPTAAAHSRSGTTWDVRIEGDVVQLQKYQ